jgi:hypothetical protein
MAAGEGTGRARRPTASNREYSATNSITLTVHLRAEKIGKPYPGTLAVDPARSMPNQRVFARPFKKIILTYISCGWKYEV